MRTTSRADGATRSRCGCSITCASRIVAFQEETGHLYNLEATPAEGTTYRFAREDRKRFPDILQAGTAEKPYYTNSSQLPVGFTDDPFEALERQDDLQRKYTGGTVLHLYMSERISSADACRDARAARAVRASGCRTSPSRRPSRSARRTAIWRASTSSARPATRSACARKVAAPKPRSREPATPLRIRFIEPRGGAPRLPTPETPTNATHRRCSCLLTSPLSDDERQPCEVWTRVMGYHRPVASFNIGKKGEHKERRFFQEARCGAA